jgi:hypothetical protein
MSGEIVVEQGAEVRGPRVATGTCPTLRTPAATVARNSALFFSGVREFARYYALTP